jgi:5-methylcytosine-specific restriction protein A
MAWSQHRSARRATLPVNWAAVRRRILRRDPTCRLCFRRSSAEVDHIADPHDHSDGNLRGACAPCHATRSALQGAQASATVRRARSAGRRRLAEPHPGEL